MKISRRNFLSGAAVAAAGLVMGGCNKKGTVDATVNAAPVDGIAPRLLRENSLKPGVFVAEGNDPAKMVSAALDEIGGLSSLIKSGDTVVVKPNIGWDRGPEYAANTNPQLVKKLIELCYEAGAKTVQVFDRTCNDARKTYQNSGIAKAAEEGGASLGYVKDSASLYDVVTAPDGVTLKSWSVYKDIMKADVVINVPILKHHGISELTIGMKNLMGIIGGDRGQLHQEIDKNLPDLTRIIPVELVIVDAYKILMNHGPRGGNLEDVKMGNQVIVSTNTTMADAYAASLAGRNPEDIGFLKTAYEQGLGEIYKNKMDIKTVKV